MIFTLSDHTATPPVFSFVVFTLAFRCHQGLGRMASEMRFQLMISMKEEEGGWHKEEANVVLRVYIISVNMRHNSSHYSTQLTTNVTLQKTKQSLHSSTQSFEAKPYLKIFSLLQELERRGPLSGLGFFTIERSTITGMLSTAVTYIIILVQFRMSTN